MDGAPALLAAIDLVTFDCFGTLVDWRQALPALGAPIEQMPTFLRECELRQRRLHRETPFADYRTLLREVGAILAPNASSDHVARWARAFGELPFFSDSAAAIHLLGAIVDVGVVSNCDAVHQLDVARRIGRAWDIAVVAEELGAYKPTDRAWDRAVAMIERRGFDRARWLHVSAWDDYDLAPAGARGIRTAYVVRPDAVPPRLGAVDVTFPDLAALARAFVEAKDGPIVYEIHARARDAALADRYQRYLVEEHLALVRACLGVRAIELRRFDDTRLLTSIRFTTRAAYRRYLDRDAPRLRDRTRELFADGDVTFERTEARVVDLR